MVKATHFCNAKVMRGRALEAIKTAQHASHATGDVLSISGDVIELNHGGDATLWSLSNGKAIENLMLADACNKIEATVGNASGAFIDGMAALTSNLTRMLESGAQKCDLIDAIDCDIGRLNLALQEHTVDAGLAAALEAILANELTNKRDVSMVIEAIKLAGLTGYVVVNGAISRHDSVELLLGCNFAGSSVISLNDIHPWKCDVAKLALIDGTIESVAEIDSLLQTAHQTGESLLICAREFAKEVIHTVTVNRVRKTLNVHLLKVPYDLRGANMLKDIAIAMNGDVVTSLRGELISAIDMQKLASARDVTVLGGMLTFKSVMTDSLAAHIDVLSKQRMNTSDHQLASLLDARIRALLGRRVEIRIQSDKRSKQGRIAAIDRAMRTTRTMLAHGQLTDDWANGLTSQIMLECSHVIANRLREQYGLVPASMMRASIEQCAQLGKTMLLSSGFVLIDD